MTLQQRGKRILYATTYAPSHMALGGAAWVDQRVLARLRQDHSVAVFPITGSPLNPVPLEVRNSGRSSAATVRRMLTTREPYQVAKFRWSPAWVRRLSDLREALKSADLLVTSQWPALLAARDAQLIPNAHLAHNVDYLLASMYDPRLFRFFHNAERTRREEVRALSRARKTFTLSSADAALLARDGVTATAIGLLEDVPARRPVAGRRVGFIGKQSWPPNREALNALRQRVLPSVRKALNTKGVELVVAGRGCESLAGEPNVTVLGEVKNVADFYRQVDVVVVPRLGRSTGISVKMLEALEHGIPAVAPARLAEDAGCAAHVLCADTEEEMAAAIISLFGASPGHS